MSRCIFHFKDSENFANIEGTDFFEEGEYLKVYNGNDLVGIFAIETMKMAYKSEKKENCNG